MTIQAQTLPDLAIDVETPWPMKRGGKQVYAKLLDFGGLPLQMRVKTHNVPDIEWSQISWDHSYVASSTDGRRRSLALVSTPDTSPGSMPWRFLVDSTSVQVNMQILKDYTAWDTVVLCLLYTRAEDREEGGKLVKPGPDGLMLTSRAGELVWEEAAGGSGCECEIATPDKTGLVPEGGLPGQTYRVSADGTAYEWASDDVITVDTNLTLYVRLDGDDANSGLEDTPEGACRTLKGAVDKLMSRYRAAITPLHVEFRLSPGVHEGGVRLHQNVYSSGFYLLRIIGSGSDLTILEAKDNYCVHTRGVQLSFDAMTLSCRNGLAHVRSQFSSYINFGADMKLTGNPGYACVWTETSSYFLSNNNSSNGPRGTLDINVNSSRSIFRAEGGSLVWLNMENMRLNGSCSDTIWSDNAEINFQPINVSGNMTGRRYYAIRHGIIDTGGRGANFIPGSTAGTVSHGGLYM